MKLFKHLFLAGVLSLALATSAFAVSKVYVNPETAVTFNDTTGATTITLNNLGDNEARISDQADLTASARSEYYLVRAVIEWENAPAAGETCDIYIATSDGTFPDADGGTTDAAFTVSELPNLMFVGSVVATTATADKEFVASFPARISTRYYSIVVHNNAQGTDDNLQATDDESYVTVTPIPPEGQ